MVSTYGIITQAELELGGLDYSNWGFADAVVDEWISQAEIFVCTKLGTTFTSTASNSIKFCVKEIARQIAINTMIVLDKPCVKDWQVKDPYTLESIIATLNSYGNQQGTDYSGTSVVRIRMDGYNSNE